MAGFIFERSVGKALDLEDVRRFLGATDVRERARVTNTPPVWTISRLKRKAKKDWWMWRT
jgi:hypothetical protein